MEERTMTFSINGDFITRLAREKCHYEGKMEYAINLLESCLESDEITDNERKGLAFAILDGRAEITGHIRATITDSIILIRGTNGGTLQKHLKSCTKERNRQKRNCTK